MSTRKPAFIKATLEQLVLEAFHKAPGGECVHAVEIEKLSERVRLDAEGRYTANWNILSITPSLQACDISIRAFQDVGRLRKKFDLR